MERKLEVGVKAVIKNEQGEYLVLKRSKPYPGLTEPMWDIPGGRINPGETLSEALAREIREETGMALAGEPKVIFAQDILRVEDKHTVRLTYIAEATGEIVLDPIEHTDHQWVNLTGLKELYHDKYLDPVLAILN
jgi:8-oxo-dGTP diphosphatase